MSLRKHSEELVLLLFSSLSKAPVSQTCSRKAKTATLKAPPPGQRKKLLSVLSTLEERE